MADIKISALPAATAVTATDVAPLVSGGNTTKATPTQMVTAALNATKVTIAQGGTGQGTAAAALTALLPTQTGNSGKVLGTNGTAASWVASTGWSFTSVTPTVSGTSIEVAIPAGTKRITLSWTDLSTTAAATGAGVIFKVAGVPVTTGYNGGYWQGINAGGNGIGNSGAFIGLATSTGNTLTDGQAIITNVGGNNWVQQSQTFRGVDNTYVNQNCLAPLTAFPDSIQINTNNAATFDGGTVWVNFEG